MLKNDFFYPKSQPNLLTTFLVVGFRTVNDALYVFLKINNYIDLFII